MPKLFRAILQKGLRMPKELEAQPQMEVDSVAVRMSVKEGMMTTLNSNDIVSSVVRRKHGIYLRIDHTVEPRFSIEVELVDKKGQ